MPTTRLREPIEPDLRRVPRPTALVVDDDVWIRALVCDPLEAEGYAVRQASNGSAALRLVRRQLPQVMLLDLALPELSGLSVLACMKADSITAQVPVIVVSGDAPSLEPRRLPGVGAICYTYAGGRS